MPGWHWFGSDYNEHGRLIVHIPLEAADPKNAMMEITAEIEDCDDDFGCWSVWEDDTLVATGQISCGDELWRNGEGPQLEAERVVCKGANQADSMAAREYIGKNPEIAKYFAEERKGRAMKRRVRELTKARA